ncbi:hypothetical protein F0L68_05980 [Solihabitans fulvus]|uniref:Uncharacterized protein n=1 Tax=Solihabitans fulvus TaxID=1892852 RepID=A0A5B2XMM7_9PSEU|nr:hypothetical protein [Solihabitans fulvus]KAA2264643.1 hypothetical protein F0L68_05980 [Solihabitans fulvus]
MDSRADSTLRHQPDHGRHRQRDGGPLTGVDQSVDQGAEAGLPAQRRSRRPDEQRAGQQQPDEQQLGEQQPQQELADQPPWGRAEPARHDPLIDTDAHGLRKFDIGLVPASVTPPRTWRRAAWFAVLSSVGVLLALALAAAKLVGPAGPLERIGLPGYPSDVQILSGLNPTPTAPATSVAIRPVDNKHPTGGHSGDARPAQDGAAAQGAPGDAGTTVATSGGGSGSTSPSQGGGSSARPPTTGSRPGAPTDSAPPTVTTVPNRDAPIVDGDAITRRTVEFYGQVVSNTTTALAMTTDTFRANAAAVLTEHYADVSSIQLKGVSVDPGSGITVSTLQVTKKDGATSTEQRQLKFTLDHLPLISDERQASDGQR